MTHGTETSYDDTSRESTPPGPPVTGVTMETAQVEAHLESPKHSTPIKEMQQDGFHQSSQHSCSTTQITPLQSIPEKTREHLTLSDRPDFRSKNSPLLRGTRFCSEVSDTIIMIIIN